MTRITAARAALVDIPVETVRTDAVQSFLKQETIIVDLDTDGGVSGRGYSYTIGTGGRAVLSMLRDHLLPAVIGQDVRRPEAVWHHAFSQTRATTTGAITSLALAAIDTAVWDARCRSHGEPLWRAAGGTNPEVPLYDTEGGWLHIDTDTLVANTVAARDGGWQGSKLKVGSPDPARDVERLTAVRDAVGPGYRLMVDANQGQTLADARARARALEPVGISWFEEPLPADDVSAHARLVDSTSIPIAVGESLYSVAQFKEYLARDAATVVQPDVARVGGITPWLKIAHLAEAFNVPVCPHFLMELHLSLVAAVPNGRIVEYIPQLRAVTTADIVVVDGRATAPETPGIGIAWDDDALDDLRVL
ncbi:MULTISPECIES: mandelate racemase/muconate lactonizing enzyme family protein [unclassified Microbacterium]|uniref:mandelate racemase/muconate lactonizing enzyme family protein n=1 Tax=unclassified Microbacterium TaxID=2609290 RepID=UPI00365141A4